MGELKHGELHKGPCKRDMEERREIWKERNERYEDIWMRYEGKKVFTHDIIERDSIAVKRRGGQEIIIIYYNYII